MSAVIDGHLSGDEGDSDSMSRTATVGIAPVSGQADTPYEPQWQSRTPSTKSTWRRGDLNRRRVAANVQVTAVIDLTLSAECRKEDIPETPDFVTLGPTRHLDPSLARMPGTRRPEAELPDVRTVRIGDREALRARRTRSETRRATNTG